MCAQGEVLPKPGDRAVVPTGILMVCLSVLMVGRLTGSPGTVGFKDHPGPGDTDHFLPRAGHGTRPRAGLLTDPRNPRAPHAWASSRTRGTRAPPALTRAETRALPPGHPELAPAAAPHPGPHTGSWLWFPRKHCHRHGLQSLSGLQQVLDKPQSPPGAQAAGGHRPGAEETAGGLRGPRGAGGGPRETRQRQAQSTPTRVPASSRLCRPRS